MADYKIPDRIEKRVRYFDGQFLKDQDFVDEQKYHINRQLLQNRLHVSGIIEGLNIQSLDGKVIVNPGTAIDKKGRLIVLTNSKEIKLENIGNFGNLVISYQEKESDVATTREENNEKEKQGSAGNTRWYENPEVTVVRKPTEEQVRLGTVKFDNEGNVVVNSLNRQYSGVFLPAGDSKGVTLRAGDEQNPNLAILDGDLSISGTLTVTKHTELDKTLTVKENTTIEQELTVKSILVGENGKGVKLRSQSQVDEKNPNLAILEGGLSISGGLTVRGTMLLNDTLTVKSILIGEKEKGVKLQSQVDEKKSSLTVTGERTLNVIVNGSLTVGDKTTLKDLDVQTTLTVKGGNNPQSDNIIITQGRIQKGEIKETKNITQDLGLYSQELGKAMRFVTNKSDFYFSSAGEYGDASKPTLKIDQNGNMEVTGEIKGKIWYSSEYKIKLTKNNGAINENPNSKMLPCKKSVAFLTCVKGRFNGPGEGVWIEKRKEGLDDYWYLCGSNGADPGYIEATAICIGTD